MMVRRGVLAGEGVMWTVNIYEDAPEKLRMDGRWSARVVVPQLWCSTLKF